MGQLEFVVFAELINQHAIITSVVLSLIFVAFWIFSRSTPPPQVSYANDAPPESPITPVIITEDLPSDPLPVSPPPTTKLIDELIIKPAFEGFRHHHEMRTGIHVLGQKTHSLPIGIHALGAVDPD